jgi:phosphohistidine phosphatase
LTIYVLRHGVAEERREGRPDATRCLTAAGKQKLRAVLRRANEAGICPEIILTSPLTRALETAAVAAEILDYRNKPVVTKALLPSSSPDRVWKEIAAIEASSVLVAGHEPLLSQFVAFLLNCPAVKVDLKKGALVRLDVSSSEPRPNGILKWMLTPKLAGA